MDTIFLSISGYIQLSETDAIPTVIPPTIVPAVPTQSELDVTAPDILASNSLDPSSPALFCYRSFAPSTGIFSTAAQLVFVPLP